MELSSDRRYHFDVGPEALWDAIAGTGEYRRWWPWLRRFDARALEAGEAWQCVVQPPLPYVLRFTIDLQEVIRPQLVAATVVGDIAGSARLEISPDGEGSAVRLTSVLSPSNRAFGLLALWARPLVRRGHDWVLDTGAAQFAAEAVRGSA